MVGTDPMKRFGALLFSLLLVATTGSAKTVVESYDVASYNSNAHSLYMNGAKYHFGVGASFQRFSDGTGSLTGTALNNGGKGYQVSLNFDGFRDWSQQMAAGLDAKGKGYGDHTSWTYMDMAIGSTLTKVGGSNNGSVYDLLMKPIGGPYTFQYGIGANDKQAGVLGLSGWFYTAGSKNNGTGSPCKKNNNNNGGSTCDFNLNLSPTPVPVPAGIALLPVGLGALVSLRRRKRRAA